MLSYDNSNPIVHCPYCCYGFDKRYNADEKLNINLNVKNMDLKELRCQKKFNEVTKMKKLLFTIYADFETLNVKLQGCEPGIKS